MLKNSYSEESAGFQVLPFWRECRCPITPILKKVQVSNYSYSEENAGVQLLLFWKECSFPKSNYSYSEESVGVKLLLFWSVSGVQLLLFWSVSCVQLLLFWRVRLLRVVSILLHTGNMACSSPRSKSVGGSVSRSGAVGRGRRISHLY